MTCQTLVFEAHLVGDDAAGDCNSMLGGPCMLHGTRSGASSGAGCWCPSSRHMVRAERPSMTRKGTVSTCGSG